MYSCSSRSIASAGTRISASVRLATRRATVPTVAPRTSRATRLSSVALRANGALAPGSVAAAAAAMPLLSLLGVLHDQDAGAMLVVRTLCCACAEADVTHGQRVAPPPTPWSCAARSGRTRRSKRSLMQLPGTERRARTTPAVAGRARQMACSCPRPASNQLSRVAAPDPSIGARPGFSTHSTSTQPIGLSQRCPAYGQADHKPESPAGQRCSEIAPPQVVVMSYSVTTSDMLAP